jgi:hypothetical protein
MKLTKEKATRHAGREGSSARSSLHRPKLAKTLSVFIPARTKNPQFLIATPGNRIPRNFNKTLARGDF